MHLVFVYGTLKSGYHNNKRFLKGFGFKQASAEGFELHGGPGFPFACRGDETIYGELYEVSDDVLARLDRLEGHPNFYKREKAVVDLEDGGTVVAWIYLSEDARHYKKIELGVWDNENL